MDPNTLQFVAVLVIVVAAAGYLLRRLWRQQKGETSACGRCGSCRGRGG